MRASRGCGGATGGHNLVYEVTNSTGVYPWSSVGKIYNSTGGACTGSLVGPNKALTAVHCMFNASTRLFVFITSGQINMRKVDGWQTLATKLIDQPIDLAA